MAAPIVRSNKVVIVGSANMDLVIGVGALPRAGQTVAGTDLRLFSGGKGANQAFAAGKLGGTAQMIGQVGDDAFGDSLIASLTAANVDVSGIGKSNRSTGCASIYVLPGGENTIVISPGANATLDPETALARLVLNDGDIVLCQLEIPLETIAAVFAHARSRRAKTILDPAPARPLPAEILAITDFLTPNQTEAAVLLNQPHLQVRDFPGATQAAHRLAELTGAAVLMKLGELGALLWDGTTATECQAFPVVPTDTTAAGDTFNGAFAVAVAEGQSATDALAFASAAAAISVTRAGAQPSIPSRSEVDLFLSRQPRKVVL